MTLGRLLLGLWMGTANAVQASEVPPPPPQTWSFQGPTGTFDRPALQRGLQVYKEVCSACHGLKFIRFRELSALGFSEAEIKAIAASSTIVDGPDDTGEMFDRPGRPADAFPSPFKNDQAARAANNGALPIDLSLAVKSRAGGPDYIYALLTGFQDPPPPGVSLMPGMYYNRAFPGHQIAMAPPLIEGAVSYSDGTPASIDQMAKDVTTFLAWASEPETETRKRMGVRFLIFMVLFAALMYSLMVKVWWDIKKRRPPSP